MLMLDSRYNGTPRGLTNCNEGGCSRCNSANETSDECVCLHAEENALLEAGRERVGDGAVLYCNTLVTVSRRVCIFAKHVHTDIQVPMSQMHDQDHTDRSQRSCIQLELQSVRTIRHHHTGLVNN